MARLYTIGYELEAPTTGVVGVEGSSGVNVTRDTGTFRSGVASLKLNTGAGPSTSYSSLSDTAISAASTTYYLRAYVNFTNLPAFSTFMGMGGFVTTNWNVNVRLSSTTIALYRIDTVIQSVSWSPATGTWYRIEFSATTDGTAANFSSAELKVDGTVVASGSFTQAKTASSVSVGFSTSPPTSVVAYVDDVALNDSSGGSQNTYPGDAKVVLLKPETDSAVGTGWTLGTGTAIAGNSGAAAVDNTPPLGVADLAAGSDAKQIRNASSATADYDTGVSSYTTAGVASADTINVVVPFIITGAPSATGAKSGNLVLVSNPAGATDSHGTYRAGANAGTYTTGWKTTIGTPQYAPSVTLGTRPVLRADITSGTAARIAMVCAMGMYVDYTPASTRVPRSPGVDSGNAHL